MELHASYRGRFAPSPTGPLHQGSLIAAVGSYLDAKASQGEWLLRIEDIDPPREVTGASDAILRSLTAHGLHWDGTPLFQSTRVEAYEQALQRLTGMGKVFACVCSRATLGPGGSCGERCQASTSERHSLRIHLPPPRPFEDHILGIQAIDPAPRDIVLRRKDGLFSYALAVVVDDAWQQISHVLRGRDLLGHTAAQIGLMECLGHTPPHYGHLPLACDENGEKLSKQSGAQALNDDLALENLRHALRYLGQHSATAEAGTPSELLNLACEHWDREAVI